MAEAPETTISKVLPEGNWGRIRKKTRILSDDIHKPGRNFNPN